MFCEYVRMWLSLQNHFARNLAHSKWKAWPQGSWGTWEFCTISERFFMHQPASRKSFASDYKHNGNAGKCGQGRQRKEKERQGNEIKNEHINMWLKTPWQGMWIHPTWDDKLGQNLAVSQLQQANLASGRRQTFSSGTLQMALQAALFHIDENVWKQSI